MQRCFETSFPLDQDKLKLILHRNLSYLECLDLPQGCQGHPLFKSLEEDLFEGHSLAAVFVSGLHDDSVSSLADPAQNSVVLHRCRRWLEGDWCFHTVCTLRTITSFPTWTFYQV